MQTASARPKKSTATPKRATSFEPRIAEAFGEAGIAVLRFNKRGVLAYGEYDYEQLQQIIVNQRIIDAEAVITTTKAQPEVDSSQLFLYGWSEEGIVATYAAHNHPEVTGLILQAPLDLSLEEALVGSTGSQGVDSIG